MNANYISGEVNTVFGKVQQEAAVLLLVPFHRLMEVTRVKKDTTENAPNSKSQIPKE